jgi:chromosome segregation ATPase
MSKPRSKPDDVARDEWLQRCAARAQETDRQAREAEEEMRRLRKEAKRARKAYRAAKDAAKQAAKEAKEAQAELRSCLDEAFREMAHTLQTAAVADRHSPFGEDAQPTRTTHTSNETAAADPPADALRSEADTQTHHPASPRAA